MNDETLDYYNLHAGQYFMKTIDADLSLSRKKFLNYIPTGGNILDFGCGSGRDSKVFIDLGYNVLAWDGSIELAKIASSYISQEVICKDFRKLDFIDTFEGIWACASLLHLPNKDLIDVLKKMCNALKEDGYIYASFKTGVKEQMVDGRYFNYMNTEKMINNLKSANNLELEDYWIDTDNLGRLDVKWGNYILKKVK